MSTCPSLSLGLSSICSQRALCSIASDISSFTSSDLPFVSSVVFSPQEAALATTALSAQEARLHQQRKQLRRCASIRETLRSEGPETLSQAEGLLLRHEEERHQDVRQQRKVTLLGGRASSLPQPGESSERTRGLGGTSRHLRPHEEIDGRRRGTQGRASVLFASRRTAREQADAPELRSGSDVSLLPPSPASFGALREPTPPSTARQRGEVALVDYGLTPSDGPTQAEGGSPASLLEVVEGMSPPAGTQSCCPSGRPSEEMRQAGSSADLFLPAMGRSFQGGLRNPGHAGSADSPSGDFHSSSQARRAWEEGSPSRGGSSSVDSQTAGGGRSQPITQQGAAISSPDAAQLSLTAVSEGVERDFTRGEGPGRRRDLSTGSSSSPFCEASPSVPENVTRDRAQVSRSSEPDPSDCQGRRNDDSRPGQRDAAIDSSSETVGWIGQHLSPDQEPTVGALRDDDGGCQRDTAEEGRGEEGGSEDAAGPVENGQRRIQGDYGAEERLGSRQGEHGAYSSTSSSGGDFGRDSAESGRERCRDPGERGDQLSHSRATEGRRSDDQAGQSQVGQQPSVHSRGEPGGTREQLPVSSSTASRRRETEEGLEGQVQQVQSLLAELYATEQLLVRVALETNQRPSPPPLPLHSRRQRESTPRQHPCVVVPPSGVVPPPSRPAASPRPSPSSRLQQQAAQRAGAGGEVSQSPVHDSRPGGATSEINMGEPRAGGDVERNSSASTPARATPQRGRRVPGTAGGPSSVDASVSPNASRDAVPIASQVQLSEVGSSDATVPGDPSSMSRVEEDGAFEEEQEDAEIRQAEAAAAGRAVVEILTSHADLAVSQAMRDFLRAGRRTGDLGSPLSRGGRTASSSLRLQPPPCLPSTILQDPANEELGPRSFPRASGQTAGTEEEGRERREEDVEDTTREWIQSIRLQAWRRSVGALLLPPPSSDLAEARPANEHVESLQRGGEGGGGGEGRGRYSLAAGAAGQSAQSRLWHMSSRREEASRLRTSLSPARQGQSGGRGESRGDGVDDHGRRRGFRMRDLWSPGRGSGGSNEARAGETTYGLVNLEEKKRLECQLLVATGERSLYLLRPKFTVVKRKRSKLARHSEMKAESLESQEDDDLEPDEDDKTQTRDSEEEEEEDAALYTDAEQEEQIEREGKQEEEESTTLFSPGDGEMKTDGEEADSSQETREEKESRSLGIRSSPSDLQNAVVHSQDDSRTHLLRQTTPSSRVSSLAMSSDGQDKRQKKTREDPGHTSAEPASSVHAGQVERCKKGRSSLFPRCKLHKKTRRRTRLFLLPATSRRPCPSSFLRRKSKALRRRTRLEVTKQSAPLAGTLPSSSSFASCHPSSEKKDLAASLPLSSRRLSPKKHNGESFTSFLPPISSPRDCLWRVELEEVCAVENVLPSCGRITGMQRLCLLQAVQEVGLVICAFQHGGPVLLYAVEECPVTKKFFFRAVAMCMCLDGYFTNVPQVRLEASLQASIQKMIQASKTVLLLASLYVDASLRPTGSKTVSPGRTPKHQLITGKVQALIRRLSFTCFVYSREKTPH